MKAEDEAKKDFISYYYYYYYFFLPFLAFKD